MLIADGEARARAAVERVVRESGLLLSVAGQAANAAELLELTDMLAPHIVVVEPLLPNPSGVDVLAELRPQVIVLTRSNRFQDAVRALEARAVAYLLKPLEPARLRAALAAAVEPPAEPALQLPAPAVGEYVCAFARTEAALSRLADFTLTAGRDHIAVIVTPDTLERVRALSGAERLGLGGSVEEALAALAAGYFAPGIVRFEDLPARDEPYPLGLERELLGAIAVGDRRAAFGHLVALTDALTRPVRSPQSARHRFRDLVGLIARTLPGASLAWADRWSTEVEAADTAASAAERLEAAWNEAIEAHAPSSGVGRAQAFVREHLDERLTVAAVAAAAGFHPDHLSHLFRRELGITVGEYVRLCRLERAKRLLASGTAPVADVASASGFGDPRYFSRAFRRATGMSPTEYRSLTR